MRTKSLRLSAGVIACAAAVWACFGFSATADSTSPRYECPPNVANCTSVTGASVSVTSGSRSLLTWAVCPAGQRPVGYSYSGGDNTSMAKTVVSIVVFPGYPNTQYSWGGVPDADRTVFFTVSENALPNHTVTVQPRIGCAPNQGGTPQQPQCPPNVANCATVSSSQIAAGPGDGTLNELSCPSGDLPVGFSYNGGKGPDTALAIQIFPAYPNTWDVNSPGSPKGLVFFRVLGSPPAILGTPSFTASSIQVNLGCAPAPAPTS